MNNSHASLPMSFIVYPVCGVFVLPPIRAWARLYLVWVSLRDSYVISFWVRHVLLVELLKLLLNTVHYRRRCTYKRKSVGSANGLNCVHNCEDHSLLDFISAVQHMKYFMYNFTFIPYGLIRTHK